ncbi:MAG: isopentenyl phosphate kinase family protein [Methanoregulaceae archaeon]|nr:isopentenyl phosphate kinase family protein [Methanoregulaceae archaeon]
MPERILLKLGGSVITDKSGDCAIDHAAISRLAGVIGSRPRTSLLIVHGAGSCGHPEAKRYRIAEGLDGSNLAGVFATHRSVLRLNDALVEALRENGLEAIGISPIAAAVTDNGRIKSFASGPLEEMLGRHMVPVLHGDVVMDCSRGASIVSGDQLTRFLAVALCANRVGLATDVPGVIDQERVVRVITPENAGDIELEGSGHPDVTDGMRGKINELLMLAREGVPSDIFHASRLADFLDGRPHGGTRVVADAR